MFTEDTTQYTKPITFHVQLRDDVNPIQFHHDVLAKLADRAWWCEDLQDWDGHPRHQDFRFSVEEYDGPARDEGMAFTIVVDFGSVKAGANWRAFGMSYASRLTRSAFESGACRVSY